MSFIFYDLAFLIIFAAFVSFFLYTRKNNLKREGLLYLYRTSWGIKLINSVGKKSPATFRILSYISVTLGYILMASMIYLLGRIVYLYMAFPAIVREIKVPPITPLIPYLPQVFKLDFLPPFYFTYWIVIIAIIAITHEFAHGIFAIHNKVKIKSTGFGFFPFFLPVFLAAFVELDEKQMAKKSIFGQLAVLSAGTFANIITAVVFFGVLLAFFSVAFTPSGVIYDTYPYGIVSPSNISQINNVYVKNFDYDRIVNLSSEEGLNSIVVNGVDYVATRQLLEEQTDRNNILLYYDAPAIRSNLESTILDINGNGISSISDLERELSKYSPGDSIRINVLNISGGEPVYKDITLGTHPEDESKAWLGIGFSQQQSSGLLGSIYSKLSSFKDRNIYYSYNELSIFIYNLLWWIVLISISVALVNMLPVGIFDGGRFFYLTILAITKKEKTAKKAFAISTYTILFVVLIMMVYWMVAFFK